MKRKYSSLRNLSKYYEHEISSLHKELQTNPEDFDTVSYDDNLLIEPASIEENTIEFESIKNDTRRRFIRNLLRMYPSLEEICRKFTPEELEKKIEEWERGKLNRFPKRNVSENLKKLKEYVYRRRWERLYELFGEEKIITRITKRFRKAFPIENIEKVYKCLKKLGVEDDEIFAHLSIFHTDPDNIYNNYCFLEKIGFDDKTIRKHLFLLNLNSKTLQRNYRSHISMIRDGTQNRDSGRNIFTKRPSLLGFSPETFKACVQHMEYMGLKIDEKRAYLLQIKPAAKRKKLAWMLRELFDYRKIPEEYKKRTIETLYSFVRVYPSKLMYSYRKLEREKEYLKKTVSEFVKKIVNI